MIANICDLGSWCASPGPTPRTCRPGRRRAADRTITDGVTGGVWNRWAGVRRLPQPRAMGGAAAVERVTNARIFGKKSRSGPSPARHPTLGSWPSHQPGPPWFASFHPWRGSGPGVVLAQWIGPRISTCRRPRGTGERINIPPQALPAGGRARRCRMRRERAGLVWRVPAASSPSGADRRASGYLRR